ncbi:hypothetical protein SKAU_G00185150 [Synaphobranchus kaupii]|uniref:Uncharacterized protein n=1 Tax=Synaphobranchus kaupii TaxID=118154 RepID=A0A9Q1IWB9_SYNKA|nr:hypothetical protein SKAU_G00185150 [Synaphobranchus kaupii]
MRAVLFTGRLIKRRWDGTARHSRHRQRRRAVGPLYPAHFLLSQRLLTNASPFCGEVINRISHSTLANEPLSSNFPQQNSRKHGGLPKTSTYAAPPTCGQASSNGKQPVIATAPLPVRVIVSPFEGRSKLPAAQMAVNEEGPGGASITEAITPGVFRTYTPSRPADQEAELPAVVSFQPQTRNEEVFTTPLSGRVNRAYGRAFESDNRRALRLGADGGG